MSDDKIAEIRARHLREDRWCYSPSPQMHDDRATLLAEVDRLRAENERLLQAVGLATTAVPELQVDIESPVGMMQRVVAEVERLTRERDEARYFLKIFLHAHASNNAVPPHLEEQARKALEGEP